MLKTLTFQIISQFSRSKGHYLLPLCKLIPRPLLHSSQTYALPVSLMSTEQSTHHMASSALEHSSTATTTAAASTYGNVDIEAIAGGDPQIEKLLKVIILEVDIFRQDGHLVPDNIETNDWMELLLLKTRSARARYLTFLFKNEKKKENRQKRMEEKRKERIQLVKEMEESGHIKYGFGGNTIFLRIYDSTMDMYLNKGLINAAMYSQHLVVDCSYDQHMTRFEAKNCARQLCLLFSDNRNHLEPFHIQICNASPNYETIKALHRYIPPMYDTSFPLFITEKSYLDLYPKERLVYLTPHCRTDLVEWNHDDVYIIGAMVDKSNPKPLSLAKAKEQGLRMAKLPLERYLVWGSGAGKSLTLNQMTSILLDRRHTGDWEKAFMHIPRRKILTSDDLVQEAKPKSRSIIRRPITYESKEVQLSGGLIKKIKPRMIDVSKLYE